MLKEENQVEAGEFYKSLLSKLNEGFIYAKMIYDQNGEAIDWLYEFVNESYEIQSGNKVEDVLFKKASQIYQTESQAFKAWLNRFDNAIKNNSNQVYEDYFAPSRKWLRVAVFSPQKDYFAATFTDISEKKEIFKALSNQKNKFQLLFDSISQGIIFQNTEGEIVDCNPTAETILGLEYNELTKRTSVNPEWKAIREDGSPFPGEEHPPMVALREKKEQLDLVFGIFNPKKEKYAWLRVNSVPIFAGRELMGVVSTFEDITEKRNSRKRLETLNKKLFESNKNLEDFAYMASHDLKQPARTVKSFTELLENNLKDKLDEKNLKILNFIKKGSQKMEDLIEELLRYSRLNTQEMEMEVFELSLAIKGAKISYSKLLEEKNIDFEIPETPQILGSKLMINRVFQNLIDNAIKYNTSEQAKIEISAEVIDDRIKVSVSDNGIGINQSNHELIFGLFKRLHTDREYEGSGFGLAICKKIIEMHNGSISLKSEVGQGSTFILEFPIVKIKA